MSDTFSALPVQDSSCNHEHASSRNVWLRTLIICALLMAVSIAARLWVLPEWTQPQFQLHGQPIQNTPDAYHWLSGSVERGHETTHPLSLLLRLLTMATNLSPDIVAYFLPIALCSIVTVVFFLWGRLLGNEIAAASCGLLGAFFPPFYGRTQLGQLDTDFATLVFPCLAAYLVARWSLRFLDMPLLSSGFAAPAPGANSGHGRRGDPVASSMAAMLLIGACLQFLGLWHPQIGNFNELLYYMAILAALFSRSGKAKNTAFWAVGIMGLASQHGLAGLAAAYLLCVSFRLADKLLDAATRSMWPGLVFSIMIGGSFLAHELSLSATALMYLNKFFVTTVHAAMNDVLLPSVTLTVAEEVKSLDTYLHLIHYQPWLTVLGYLGFLFLVLRRPVLVFLLPLAVLSCLGPLFGVRLAMFGAPVMGLGLCLPPSWAVERLVRNARLRTMVHVAVQALVLALFFAPYIPEYKTLPPSPVVSKEQGDCLKRLSVMTPPNAWIWNEWVYGYATEYYARRNTVLHGGFRRRSGNIYLMDKIYMTRSPRFAARLMTEFAAKNFYTSDFWRPYDNAKIQSFFDKLEKDKNYARKNTIPQYIVVSYDLLPMLNWMYYFANWDFSTLTSSFPQMQQVTQGLDIDMKKGLATTKDKNETMLFETIDIISSKKQDHGVFSHKNGKHLILNKQDKEHVYIVDGDLYESLLIQSLINKKIPEDIAAYFSVKVDVYPQARVLQLNAYKQ